MYKTESHDLKFIKDVAESNNVFEVLIVGLKFEWFKFLSFDFPTAKPDRY